MLHRLIAAGLYPRCCVCGVRSWRELCSGCIDRGGVQHRTAGGLPALALGSYGSEIGELVRRLKYGEETALAVRLGRALGACVPASWQQCVLVPIPLHPQRLAERGFNQAALLSRHVGSASRMTTKTELVHRSRQTRAQAELKLDERSHNVRGAFSAPRASPAQRVVIVDDVMTTGGTTEACAHALREAGHHVEGALCCALGRSAHSAEPEDGESVASFIALRSP